MENLVLLKEEAKRLDAFAINKLGIPSLVLMENAGRSTSFEILSRYPWAKTVVIFVYKGNNGGDGLVVARYLADAGKEVKVVLLANPKKISKDAKRNYDIAKNLNIPFVALTAKSTAKVKKLLKDADLVVDAIFGVGLSSKISGFLAKVIKMINAADKPVKVAIDIPSGIDANTGKILGTAIYADLTVTMAFVKKGLLEPDARDFVGKVAVADIGIPKHLFGKKFGKGKKVPVKIAEKGVDVITSRFVAQVLGKRKYDSNKGDFGKVLIIAGSLGMAGAAILAARAAIRSGAGLVYVATPESLNTAVETSCVEAVTLPMPETKVKALKLAAVEKLKTKLKAVDAILIGPGISTSPETKEFFFALLFYLISEKIKTPVIIDADGLNCLADSLAVLEKCAFPVVLTPHPGEFSRLTEKPIPEIKHKRIALAEGFAEKHKVNLILKGAYSVCSKGKKKTSINFTGNPGMASAGMGDVLAGLLVSLIGQGLSSFDAIRAATFIHGLAGDVIERQVGVHGLVASGVVDTLPVVLKSLYRG